jgi:hypothetical protein
MDGVEKSSDVTSMFEGASDFGTSKAVVDGPDTIWVGAVVDGVDIDGGKITSAFGVSGLNAGVLEIPVDTFGVGILPGLEASIDTGAVSEVSSALGINEFRTDCAVYVFFSYKITRECQLLTINRFEKFRIRHKNGFNIVWDGFRKCLSISVLPSV